MVRRAEPEPADHDERLGEAIETYLELAEKGHAPDPEEFAGRYPDLRDDLFAALEGLSLVRGLVGSPTGPGHRLESGHRIAGYRIVRELGRGGMGIVYEAVHLGLDRPVALKVLGSHAAPDSSGRRRFLNEAKTAAGLHHTHIVPVFDVGQVGGLCYYAMQRIEGCGLERVLRHMRRDRSTAAGSSTGSASPGIPLTHVGARSGVGLDETASWSSRAGTAPNLSHGRADRDDAPPPFEPPRGSAYYRWVAEVGRQAAEALAHAHHRGVIHRDVKPSNLLLDARGMIWMTDFGLARRLADPSLTQHDSLLGTPRYMSPEQANPGPIDGRSDVYSLGATLYELLTLRPPFEGRTAAELVDQIRAKDPIPARLLDRRIPIDLETIVLKALAKRANDRYASAQELADDLERFLNHEPVLARRIGPIGRLWRVARRHPGMSAVSTVAAITISIVVTVAYIRVLRERDQTKAALRSQLLSQAQVERVSNVPNRRVRGLSLLSRAAHLDPEGELRSKLREEAIEFLIVRDVEARPEFPTGRNSAIAFTADGEQLASLSDDLEKLSFWDLESRQLVASHELRPVTAGKPKGPLRGPGRGGRWRGIPIPQLGLAITAQKVAAVLPDSMGCRLFDSRGKAVIDLKVPGWRIHDVFGDPGSRRLVTVSTRLSDRTFEFGGNPTPLSEFQLSLWDTATLDESNAPIAVLDQWIAPNPFDHPLVSFEPDGLTIAVARTRGKQIALHSARTGKKLDTIETQAEVSALAMGPHGQLAVAGGGVMRIWDTSDTRMNVASLNLTHGPVTLVRFNPTGTILAAAVGRGRAEVELWDTASNSLVSVLPTAAPVMDLAFTPDGRTLAASIASTDRHTATSVWAVIEPVARLQLSGFDTPPASMAFRADGLLALGTSSGSIRYWRPGRCLSTSPSQPEGGDESSLDPGLSPWELRPLVGLGFDDRGRLTAIDSESDALRIWSDPGESSEGTLLPFPRSSGQSNPERPMRARAADGRTLVFARGSDLFLWRADEPHRFEPIDLVDLRETRAGRLPYAWRAIALSPTADRLYLVSHSGAIHAWALESNRAVREEWVIPGSPGGGGAGPGRRNVPIAISPDGSVLGLLNVPRGVTLVDTKLGKVRSQFRIPDGEPDSHPTVLAFSPEDREFVVGTTHGSVYVYALDQPGNPRIRLPGAHGYAFQATYDSTGRYLAVLGQTNKVVDVWDLERIRTELARLDLGW